MSCINLDKRRPSKKGWCTDLIEEAHGSEVVGTKTSAALESDFLSTFHKSRPEGRPKGGLTIAEMAKAANSDHMTIKRWLDKQKGYKAILGTKQYATRKQVVTYYVKK